MTLDILKADSLDATQHGFFTRKGGASSGVFSGLNCGLGSSDQTDIVRINRARVAKAMHVATEQLVTAHQTHSSAVATLDASPERAPEVDGLVTNVPGLALGILTADCQPVLFSDAQAGVIGAAHAGWKGAVDGILEATIDAMVALGASRDNIHAAIGPCISQANYEVGTEFFDLFFEEDPENAMFFANGLGDKYLFDLPRYGLHRLRRAGVQAEWIGQCTYADADRFYSYRRCVHKSEGDYGRLISVIEL